ncbi:MAG: fumarylacetoacetate hydrolase family protein [Bacteriovoracales bacterium]|nr:fumarylacetoacetate hydrolase family protein [Bacteriovoracales bacterium]
MNEKRMEEMAARLTEARLLGRPIDQLSASTKDFPRSCAYGIQERGMIHRLQRGEKRLGFKMGLTSEAKRRQMDLDSPLYGELTGAMELKAGEGLDLSTLIHPKIEPEVAFLINSDLQGSVTREEVLAALGGVCCALEVLDSRYKHFKYFSMEDVISDNSSSSHFVTGPWVSDFSSLNLADLSMTMKVDGKIVSEGNSKAISGDPVQSVVELCGLLTERKRILPKGSLVLAGAATAAEMLRGGMGIHLQVEGLGEVETHVQ